MNRLVVTFVKFTYGTPRRSIENLLLFNSRFDFFFFIRLYEIPVWTAETIMYWPATGIKKQTIHKTRKWLLTGRNADTQPLPGKRIKKASREELGDFITPAFCATTGAEGYGNSVPMY